jgi:hypothetical protein
LEQEAVFALDAPIPLPAHAVDDGIRVPREDDVGRRHVGGHEPDEVVRTQQLPEKRDNRLVDGVRALDADVRRIKKDHEDAVARIRSSLKHVTLGVDVALALGTRPHHDVLEGGDFLEHAVLEDLEVPPAVLNSWLFLWGRHRLYQLMSARMGAAVVWESPPRARLARRARSNLEIKI